MSKFCTSVDIQDVITCATFSDDRLWDLGVTRGRISRFPVDLRRRPYKLQHSRTIVRVCNYANLNSTKLGIDWHLLHP